MQGFDGSRTSEWTRAFCNSLSATCERIEQALQSNESGLPLFGGGWTWAANFTHCLVWVTAVSGAAKAAAGASGKKAKKGKVSSGSEGQIGKGNPWPEGMAADELYATAADAAKRLQVRLSCDLRLKTPVVHSATEVGVLHSLSVSFLGHRRRRWV